MYQEAIEHGAEDVVVIEDGKEAVISAGLIRGDAIDGALVEIGYPDGPHAAVKIKEVAVLRLGQVIKGTGSLWIEKLVFPTLMFHLQITFFNIDIGGAIDSHGSQLDDMAVDIGLFGRVDHIGGGHKVISNSKDGLAMAHHGVRRGGLLGVMNHALGLKLLEYLQEKGIIADVADMDANPAAAEALPEGGALVQVGNGDKGFAVEFGAGQAPEVIIHQSHIVAPSGEIHGSGPTQVTVAPQNQDTHAAILMPATEGERSSGKSRLLKRKAFISSLLMGSSWEELYG